VHAELGGAAGQAAASSRIQTLVFGAVLLVCCLMSPSVADGLI